MSQPTRTRRQHPGRRPVSLLARARRPATAALILAAASTLGTAGPSVAQHPGSDSDSERSSWSAATVPDTVLVAVD